MCYLARPSATEFMHFTLETFKAALALGCALRKAVAHPRHCCLGQWKVDKNPGEIVAIVDFVKYYYRRLNFCVIIL